jgi:tetratricopeptide (TPR) repeat protein
MRLAAVPLVALLAVATILTTRSIQLRPPQEVATTASPVTSTEVAPQPGQPLTRSLAPSPAAEEALRRRLFSAEDALGATHPDVAAILIELASLYQSQRRQVEAEALYERALAIQELALGARHPDVAATLKVLAQVYRARGRSAEAQELSERAAGILDAVPGR